MKHPYAVPAAIALALHATLLFGFRRPHYVKPDRTKTANLTKPFEIRPEIEIVEVPHRSVEEVPYGSKDEMRPEAGKVDRPPTVNEFPIYVTLEMPNRPKLHGPVSFAPPGDPSGTRLDGADIFPVHTLENHPSARSQIPPEYPYSAKASGLTGEVLVEFIVDTTGRVHDARVVRSSDRIFDEAAVRAILRWRFEPGKSGGRLVSFRMAVPIVFSLTD